MKFLATPLPGKPFCHALQSSKILFGHGSSSDPAGGAYDAPPDPLVDWEGDTPSPNPTRRRVRHCGLGTSISMPTASHFQRIQWQRSGRI